MSSTAETVARHLLQIKAIKLNPEEPFTWASGMLSPIYCDNRLLLSHVAQRREVHGAMQEAAVSFGDFDAVGGVATAGIPHAAVLAHELQRPLVYVRSKPKAHGRQNRIEGDLQPGWKVLLIEDLISTGGSSIQAVEALRKAGAEVVGVLAIFTYGFQKAETNFREADCPYRTLTNFDKLIDLAARENYIKSSALQQLMQWRDQVA